MSRKIQRRRKPRRSVVIAAVAAGILLAIWLGFKVTENGVFTVIDYSANPKEIGTWKHYGFAAAKLNALDPDTPACIENESGKVVAIRSGVVDFSGKPVTENTLYTMENGEQGYLNGSYGVDGLYLGTSGDGRQVKFQMAGTTGWVDVQDVSLRFYSNTVRLSGYSRYQDSLVHQVSTGLDGQEPLAYSIGSCPSFIDPDVFYFSYDGHWFYKDFYTMSEAMRTGEGRAVNEKPWYNPWQFTPHRTLSSLTNADGNAALAARGITRGVSSEDTWPLEAGQSVLFDAADLFSKVQQEDWMNARMMFALAMNESGAGQSEYAVDRHNVFGHEAGDENPDAASGYPDLLACVQSHAWDWLQKKYANPGNEVWHGSWFGDKGSGINVMYASDPYWGEKAASFLYRLGFEPPELITRDGSEETPVYDRPGGSVVYVFAGPAMLVKTGEARDGYLPVRSEAPLSEGKVDVEIPYEETDIVWIPEK
nr:glucosaminidase domain-containing protein [Faecalibaculum rodentium]